MGIRIAVDLHFEQSAVVPASPEDVFDFSDDHAQFSSHMASSSWMMAGSSMHLELDERHGREVGSHIRMRGAMLGIHLSLDEVVTRRERPRHKEWETVGAPRLLILSWYRMGVHVGPEGDGTRVAVFIDYRRPAGVVGRLLSALFGGLYARWCVRQMLNGVVARFARA